MSVKYINSGVDLNAISELHRKNSPQNRCSEVLDWQYNTHKANGATIFAAVDENGDVVGSQGAIYYKLLVAGKEINSFKSEATLIESNSRQKVDFLTLYQSCINHIEKFNCDLFWGITPIPKLFAAFGMKNLGNLNATGILPLNHRGILELYQQSDDSNPKKIRFYRVASFFHFILFYSIFKLSVSNKKLPGKIKIINELKKNDDIINLHLKLNSQYKDQIFLYQDCEMIKWRIDSNPVKKIHKFFLYNEDDLQGYCYLQENDTNLEILEMAFLDHKFIKPLLKYLVVNYRKCASSLLIMLNPENEIAKTMISVLKSTGFWILKNKAFFTVMTMGKGKKLKYPESDASKWFLSGLWREGV
jgi:hypothetical protein